MPSNLSPAVARAAMSLRASHPTAPAREILDLVLQGRSGPVDDFGAELAPGTGFALLVAEAIDGEDMMPAWTLWRRADPVLKAMLDERWREEVMPRFAEAYGLAGAPATASLAQAATRRNGPRRRAAA